MRVAILDIPYSDAETNTSGGIWFMREMMFTVANGDRLDAPNIGIVITDGESSVDRDLTVPYAQDAKADGITVGQQNNRFKNVVYKRVAIMSRP